MTSMPLLELRGSNSTEDSLVLRCAFCDTPATGLASYNSVGLSIETIAHCDKHYLPAPNIDFVWNEECDYITV